jgi:hypothetical protein
MVFNPVEGDTLVVGGLQPFHLDPGVMNRRVANSGLVQRDLGRVFIQNMWDLWATLVTLEKGVKFFVGSGPLNTDDHPILEFSSPKHMNEVNVHRDALPLLRAASLEGQDRLGRLR